MDTIELISRHGTHPYEAVTQEDSDLSNLPAVNEMLPTNEPGSTTTSNHSGAITRARSGGESLAGQLASKTYRKWDSKSLYCGFAFACLIGILIPIIILFSIMGSSQDATDLPDSLYSTLCTDLEANSTFHGPIEQILDIDVAFGDLSFSQAKLIDLVWDIGFSRGGQFILGWITYKVHTAAMLRIMETHRVSYDFFSTLSLSWPGLQHLIPMVKVQLGRGSWLLLWVTLSTLWVILWPTLTNALTGYVESKGTLVKLLDNPGYINYSTIANPETLAFQCVNLSRPNPAELGGYAAIGPVLTSSGPNISFWDTLNEIIQNDTAVVPGWQAWLRTGLDVGNNITAIPIFYYNNESYAYDYFQNETYVKCVTSGSYQWGFSYSVLFYFIILNGLWVIATFIVWTCLFRKSRFVRHRPIGSYRAILDMAEIIHEILGDNLCAYTDEELQVELNKLPGVRYIVEDGESNSPGYIGLTSKQEDGTRAILSYDKERLSAFALYDSRMGSDDPCSVSLSASAIGKAIHAACKDKESHGTMEIKAGASYATPVAAGVAAMVMDFVWSERRAEVPVERYEHQSLRSKRGMSAILALMVNKDDKNPFESLSPGKFSNENMARPVNGSGSGILDRIIPILRSV